MRPSSPTSTPPTAPARHERRRRRHRRRLRDPRGAAARHSPPPAHWPAARDHLRDRGRADPVDVPAPWGQQRRAGLRAFFASVVVLPRSLRAATVWGEIQGHARLRGRPQPIKDSRIAGAASSAIFPLPRSTSGITPKHEGLELVHRGHSLWNSSWNEPQHIEGHQRHKSRRESPGRIREGGRDPGSYRCPDAGAQVRILPGAPC